MGCDIHAVFQRRLEGEWIDVPSHFQEDRHYMLFAWLANVRNGFGFAGIPMHEPLTPISEPRGLPEGFELGGKYGEEHQTSLEVIEASWRAKYRDPTDALEVWMGDHSHSWLTADEILSAKHPAVLKTGVISIEAFREWDGETEPESYSGGISGPAILVSNPSEICGRTTHVQVHWDGPRDELAYFVDEVKRLKSEYGEVRMVFGFDS